jgi:hypothetical protein
MTVEGEVGQKKAWADFLPFKKPGVYRDWGAVVHLLAYTVHFHMYPFLDFEKKDLSGFPAAIPPPLFDFHLPSVALTAWPTPPLRPSVHHMLPLLEPQKLPLSDGIPSSFTARPSASCSSGRATS